MGWRCSSVVEGPNWILSTEGKTTKQKEQDRAHCLRKEGSLLQSGCHFRGCRPGQCSVWCSTQSLLSRHSSAKGPGTRSHHVDPSALCSPCNGFATLPGLWAKGWAIWRLQQAAQTYTREGGAFTPPLTPSPTFFMQANRFPPGPTCPHSLPWSPVFAQLKGTTEEQGFLFQQILIKQLPGK